MLPICLIIAVLLFFAADFSGFAAACLAMALGLIAGLAAARLDEY